MKGKSVCLFSGGLDSTTLLWSLRPNVKALLFNYGQRHQIELQHAQRICEQFSIEYQLADLRPINHLLRSGSQSGDEQVPDGHYAEDSMKTTIVPNRNAIMIAIACGWAVSTGSEAVYYAAHSGDHAIYPDCRREFVEPMANAMYAANLWSPIHLLAPFITYQKRDIVKLANQLGVPLMLTWSCYKGGKMHCGRCGTCTERREAFLLADIPDPTAYEYKGPLMEKTK